MSIHQIMQDMEKEVKKKFWYARGEFLHGEHHSLECKCGARENLLEDFASFLHSAQTRILEEVINDLEKAVDDDRFEETSMTLQERISDIISKLKDYNLEK